MKALFKTLAVSAALLLFGATSFIGCAGGAEEEPGETTPEEELQDQENEEQDEADAEEE